MKFQSTFKWKHSIIALLQFALSLCVLFVAASNTFAQSKVIEKQDRDKYKVGFAYVVPLHLPITVEVRNLDKEDWMSEFEFEVKNTGEKPIYFLMFGLTFIGTKYPSGDSIGFSLAFGRRELIDIANNKATAEDIAIKSGESYTFKIPKWRVEEWEKMKERHGIPDPKGIRLNFSFLSFGDGTGYQDVSGTHIAQTGGSL